MGGSDDAGCRDTGSRRAGARAVLNVMESRERHDQAGVVIKRNTAKSFGYLWAQERLAGVQRGYHYQAQIKPWLPPGHLRGRVLDAGCGSGMDTFQMAQEHDGQVIAVELSREGVTHTQGRTRAFPNVMPIQGDVEALSFRDGSFDFVYSYGVLHHLPNPEQGFRELVRVLKPGGVIAIYVYEDFSTHAGLERALLWWVGVMRRLTVRFPAPLLYRLCQLCAPLVFVTLTMPATLLARWTMTSPLSQRIPFRHGRSFFGLSGDLYDRFSAPLEQRYSRQDVERWFAGAKLQEVTVIVQRGWVAYGRKPAADPAP